MKQEQQVCSLGQAQKLKELGVCQCSYLGYVKRITRGGKKTPFLHLVSGIANYPHLEVICSAFNVAELGRMINWNYISITPPYEKNEKEWGLHTTVATFTDEN